VCPSVARHEKKSKKEKEKNENRISSPIFTSDPQFPNLTPNFPNFNEIQKVGMKPDWVLDWGGIYRKLLNFYFGCEKSFPLGYQIQIGKFEVSSFLECDKSIPLEDF